MNRLLAIAVFLAALSGCAAPPIYSWGDYEPMLYATYKDPTRADELRVALESLIAETEQRKQKVPPGIYAELGTLYMQAGATDKAISQYTKERNAWPESRGMMDALIKNLERRQKPAEEVASK